MMEMEQWFTRRIWHLLWLAWLLSAEPTAPGIDRSFDVTSAILHRRVVAMLLSAALQI